MVYFGRNTSTQRIFCQSYFFPDRIQCIRFLHKIVLIEYNKHWEYRWWIAT